MQLRFIVTFFAIVSTISVWGTEKYEFLGEIMSDGTLHEHVSGGSLKQLSPGSLFKPFLAIYLAEKNLLKAKQKIFCPGSKKSAFGLKKACWRNPGHGWTNLEKALGDSCNYYFYSLSGGIQHHDFFQWLHAIWGFPAGLSGETYDALIGHSLDQNVSAASIIHAYHKLFLRLDAGQVADNEIRLGLLGAGYGTLKEFSRKLRAHAGYRFIGGKTGTSRENQKTTGAAVAYIQHRPSGRKFVIFAASEKKMGSAVAADILFSIFANETKNRKIP